MGEVTELKPTFSAETRRLEARAFRAQERVQTLCLRMMAAREAYEEAEAKARAAWEPVYASAGGYERYMRMVRAGAA
jgi:hypothetical protein